MSNEPVGIQPAIYDLIWPGEEPYNAQAMGAQLLSLRERPIPMRIRAVNMTLGLDENRQVALVLISDDASKLASVQHVPTDVLFRLVCTSLATARMRLESRLTKEERGESAELKTVMDSQMAELRRQLGESAKKMEYMDHKMSGMTEVVVDIKGILVDGTEITHKKVDGLGSDLSRWEEIIEVLKKNLGSIAEWMRSISMNLNGLITDNGGTPRSESLRAGVTAALRR